MSRRFKEHNVTDPEWQEKMNRLYARRQRNRLFFGIALVIVGIGWMFDEFFHFDLDWSNNWPLILIAVGLLIGIKNGFTNSAWWILCLIGGISLVDNYVPQYTNYAWPVALIAAGLAIAFKPRPRDCGPKWKMNNSITAESTLNIDVTFGGRKELITSRNFEQGSVSISFGGCELNFMQADFLGPTAVLDLKVAFGGVEIILPPNWKVQNEISASFGNVEDERPLPVHSSLENTKTLILKGNCSFGNVEIKSY